MTHHRIHRSVHPLSHAAAWLAVAALAMTACGTGPERAANNTESLTSTATTTPAVTDATAASTQPAPEPLVFEGTYVNAGEAFRALPGGGEGHVPFVLSGSLSGDLTGQRAIIGALTPDGTEGSAVLVLHSSETGEGVLASQFEGVITDDELSVTGDLTGVSGAFAGLVGTITTTGSPGADSTGTYRIELEPAPTSPTSSEAATTMTIDYVMTMTADLAWRSSASSFGGGSTITGDVVGSDSNRSNDGDGPDGVSIVHICECTLGADGDGVFVAWLRSEVQTGDGFARTAEFFGVSGAFEGLHGEGTATSISTRDASGAWAPISAFTFEVTR